jgi:hypothetical protein
MEVASAHHDGGNVDTAVFRYWSDYEKDAPGHGRSWDPATENARARKMVLTAISFLVAYDSDALRWARHFCDHAMTPAKLGRTVVKHLPIVSLGATIGLEVPELVDESKLATILDSQRSVSGDVCCELILKMMRRSTRRDATKLSVRGALALALSGASAGTDGAMGGVFAESIGAPEAIASVLLAVFDYVGDLVADQAVDHLADVLEHIHVTPLAWVTYLAAKPRLSHLQPAAGHWQRTAELYRLALRVLLGGPLDIWYRTDDPRNTPVLQDFESKRVQAIHVTKLFTTIGGCAALRQHRNEMPLPSLRASKASSPCWAWIPTSPRSLSTEGSSTRQTSSFPSSAGGRGSTSPPNG